MPVRTLTLYRVFWQWRKTRFWPFPLPVKLLRPSTCLLRKPPFHEPRAQHCQSRSMPSSIALLASLSASLLEQRGRHSTGFAGATMRMDAFCNNSRDNRKLSVPSIVLKRPGKTPPLKTADKRNAVQKLERWQHLKSSSFDAQGCVFDDTGTNEMISMKSIVSEGRERKSLAQKTTYIGIISPHTMPNVQNLKPS